MAPSSVPPLKGGEPGKIRKQFLHGFFPRKIFIWRKQVFRLRAAYLPAFPPRLTRDSGLWVFVPFTAAGQRELFTPLPLVCPLSAALFQTSAFTFLSSFFPSVYARASPLLFKTKASLPVHIYGNLSHGLVSRKNRHPQISGGQVFWLQDRPTGRAFPSFRTVASMRFSSPVTAADPRRTFTVFPLATKLGYPLFRGDVTIYPRFVSTDSRARL